MTFKELNINKQLIKALDEIGYTTPTTIQRDAFSIIMSGKDVLGLAQTGTGKTMAYILPLLSMWRFSKEPHPQILVIVPTRELVEQVVREIEKVTTYLNCVAVGVFGGANINTQAEEVLKGLDVLVGTPGRIFDLAASGSLQLKQIKKLVIDEVDETLNLGFRSQLTAILDMLPQKRQNLFFSATLSEEVERFIQKYIGDYFTVEAAGAGTPLEKINQQAFEIPNFKSKVNLLFQLLVQKDFSKTLVFTSSKEIADHLFESVNAEFPDKSEVIHSNKSQNYRFRAVREFRDGAIDVLIATDLIARGIDVPDVSHVIHFDLPEDCDTYIHRIGRTGRQEKTGVAIAFVKENEKELFESFKDAMKSNIPFNKLPDEIEISTEMMDFEKPSLKMRETLVKQKKRSNSIDAPGPAFHEKKEKNKKVNKRYDHKKAMHEKYGKPKTRRGKH